MTKTEILNRKGARKIEAIPTDVLQLLNKGEIETVNLTEWLAVNQVELIEHTFSDFGLSQLIKPIKIAVNLEKKKTTMVLTKLIGKMIYEYCVENKTLKSTTELLSKHKSDTIRCYATYLISLDEALNIEEKLEQSKNLIADSHFGVREIVWMALRPNIEDKLTESLQILKTWTTNRNENIRRFTTEVTRPRGVWCKHLTSLKNNPEQAIEILENLKSDDSKYVQNSVANWLNDASKTQPRFVIETCTKWEAESPTKETKYIVKRALRTINKE